MSVKQGRWGLALLWLYGCATPAPTPQVQEQEQAQEQEQEQKQEQEQEQLQLQVQAQAQMLARAKMLAQVQEEALTLTAPRMLVSLERVAALEPKIAKQMIGLSHAKSTELTAGDRFELVLLLSRKGMDDKSLKRALLLLDGLEAEAREPGVREILRLQRRNLHLEQQYRMEQRKTTELQKKIEHLKGLERELDESNRRMEAPLSPKQEHVQ